jgi:hypothetical protein
VARLHYLRGRKGERLMLAGWHERWYHSRRWLHEDRRRGQGQNEIGGRAREQGPWFEVRRPSTSILGAAGESATAWLSKGR